MSERSPRRRWLSGQEGILLGLLLAEVLVFGVLGDAFLTRTNASEVMRLSVEVGLLAVALTPVIVTGGIDLSVGSLMGLCAVVFGWLCVAAHQPVWLAALATLAVGAAAGALNGWLITRLRVPPLIVTLATWSLFRGLAEGSTGAIANYTDLPPGFLWLGQGQVGGVLPAQLPLFGLIVIAFAVLLHRTAFGRTLFAIGHSPGAARHAGVPVERNVALIYVLCGLTVAVATLVYVARLGQAKADAGYGYELLAITAVVLGGTAIEGGRGTVLGTLLGLLSITVLETGLRLAELPAELAGILIGLLLLGAIGAQRWLGRPVASVTEPAGEMDMKNSQVAAVCATMVLCAALVAGSNWLLVNRMASRHAPVASAPTPAAAPAPTKRVSVAMMPKSKGDPYFVSCRAGAEKAAQELGVDLIWDGPTETDAAKQNEVVEAWITKRVDAIAVSVQNPEAISTVLRKARQAGIKVVTWDADAQPDARDVLINQATPEGIGTTLCDEANRVLNGQGDFAIITSTLTAANQNEWIRFIKQRLGKYPGLKLVATEPGEDQQDKAFEKTTNVLKAYPNVKLIMAISAPAVPGAAEAVKQSGRSDVKVIGLSLPNMCKPYIHSGIIDCIVLWKTWDLGYLTVQASKALVDGTLKPGSTSEFSAGSLGRVKVNDSEVLLGQPFVFNKGNVDQFDF